MTAPRTMVPGVVEPDPAWVPPALPVATDRGHWEEEGRWHRWRIETDLWRLADWLVAGRAWDHGCTVSARVTGYSVSHLRNVRSTGEVFPGHVRSATLSFTAHVLLRRERDPEARLRLHAMAVALRWTPDDVRRYFLTREAPTPQPTTSRLNPARYVRVRCPACTHVFPIKGHKV